MEVIKTKSTQIKIRQRVIRVKNTWLGHKRFLINHQMFIFMLKIVIIIMKRLNSKWCHLLKIQENHRWMRVNIVRERLSLIMNLLSKANCYKTLKVIQTNTVQLIVKQRNLKEYWTYFKIKITNLQNFNTF